MISKIFGSLEYAKREINEWYDLVKTKGKKRVVTLYNNIDLNHIIRNKELYLLSWDKAKTGIPIYDLYITNHINDLIEECNKTIVLIQEYMNGIEEKTIQKIEEKAEEAGNSLVYKTNTILVVDDSNIVRNFVKKIFSNEYNVGEAKDGNETIKILEANKDNNYIQAMLLDLNMPKIDGFGVLEYMRDHDYLEKIPVSIISGDSSKETIKKAFTYDIVDMLEKPFNNQSIKLVVEKTLMMKENK